MTYPLKSIREDREHANPVGVSDHASSTPPSDGGAPRKRRKTVILAAAGWTTGGYAASQVLRIGSNLVLTRLLAPEMFGIAAVATMVALIVALLSDIGLHQAVIQSARGDEPEFLDTAWVIQIIRGVLIWIGCIAIALAISRAASLGWFPAQSVYAAPELPMVIIISTSGVAIVGFEATKLITSYRHLGLHRVTMIELYSQLGSILIGVAVAWFTRSVWACVVFGPTSALITTVLSHVWLPGRQNRFRVDRGSALELLRFGRWIMFSSFFTILAANGDRILLGNWTDSHTFGLYTLAFGLIAMLDGIGSRLQAAVAMPALSQIARDSRDRFRKSYLQLRAPFDIFYLLSAGGIFACGQLVINVIYDGRYAAAGPMLQILSVGLVTARYGMMNPVYLSIGEPRNVGMMNFAKAGLLFIAVPTCFWLFGFTGALWAIALHQLPVILLVFFYNSRHRLNSLSFELLVLLAWPAGYATGRVVVWLANHFLSGTGVAL